MSRLSWLRSSTVKLVVIGVLALGLWIPTAIIGAVVQERSSHRDEVVEEVSATWGADQTIAGPVLSVPVRSTIGPDDKGRHRMVTRWAHILPDDLEVTGQLVPEIRYRAIYEVVLYTSRLRLVGSFSPPDAGGLGVAPENVMWERAVVSLGVTDAVGLREIPRLTWNGETMELEPGVGRDPFGGALGARVPLKAPDESTELAFSVDLELAGSEGLAFLPVARDTRVRLTAPWPDPSFGGSFLPVERSIDDDGFEARWKVLSLNRDVPQNWVERAEEFDSAVEKLRCAAFGVRLLFPVDGYQRTMRSVKYSLIFSLLTFLGFFAVELATGSSIHPVQYIVIGFALCLFYLLLLSLSELMSFNLAYLVAAAGIVGQVTGYCHAILRRKRCTVSCLAVLAVVYGSLFIMLQLTELALLMGSLLLVLLCTVLMVVTRRLGWAEEHA